MFKRFFGADGGRAYEEGGGVEEESGESLGLQGEMIPFSDLMSTPMTKPTWF